MRLRSIPGIDGFYITDTGSLYRRHRGGDRAFEISPAVGITRDGRPFVTLRCHRYKLADLVLLAFVGPRPFGHRVHYADGNRHNLNLSNLSYVWEYT